MNETIRQNADEIRDSATVNVENKEVAVYEFDKEFVEQTQIPEKTTLTTVSLFARFLARENWGLSERDVVRVDLSTSVNDYGTMWEIVVYQKHPEYIN
jgi:hypothetical protein